MLIKMQAFFRRVLSRKAIRDCIEIRDMYRMHARYFARVEIFEMWKFDMQNGHGVEKWLDSGSIFRAKFVDSLLKGFSICITNKKKYDVEKKNKMMDGEENMEWGIS